MLLILLFRLSLTNSARVKNGAEVPTLCIACPVSRQLRGFVAVSMKQFAVRVSNQVSKCAALNRARVRYFREGSQISTIQKR